MLARSPRNPVYPAVMTDPRSPWIFQSHPHPYVRDGQPMRHGQHSTASPRVLLAVGVSMCLLAACTGDRGRTFRRDHDHAQTGQTAVDSKSVAQAKVQAHARTHAGPHAAKSGAPAAKLPDQPTGINYPAPFDGTPISTQVTATGLKVEDFVAGTGAPAGNGSSVNVHYTGYLTDGTVFDSSIPRNRPYTVTIGQGRVIKGWDEGLQGMRAGGKRRLTIPPELGYGDRGKGKIPAGATLVFTLEAVGIAAPLPEPQPLSIFAGTPVATDKRPDGLEIADFQLGSGALAKKGDTVQVHYRGTLTSDGTEFDSSYGGKNPIKFRLGVGRVIKGWDEGIVGMRVGGVRTLKIPAALGYGERGRGKIPPNADLTFNVELMSITPGVAPQ